MNSSQLKIKLLIALLMIFQALSVSSSEALDLQFDGLLEQEPRDGEEIPTYFKVYISGDVVAGPLSYRDLKNVSPEWFSDRGETTALVTVKPILTVNKKEGRSLNAHRQKVLKRLNPQSVTRRVVFRKTRKTPKSFPFGTKSLEQEQIINLKAGSGTFYVQRVDTPNGGVHQPYNPQIGVSKAQKNRGRKRTSAKALLMKLDLPETVPAQIQASTLSLRFYLKSPPRGKMDLNLYLMDWPVNNDSRVRTLLQSISHKKLLSSRKLLIDTTTISPLNRSLDLSLKSIQDEIAQRRVLPWMMITATPPGDPTRWLYNITFWGDHSRRTPSPEIMPAVVIRPGH
ncbi:MAG: hypothetical protein ABEK50_05150 [bacterium]